MALPTVHLTDIPDEGLSLRHEVQPGEIALGVTDAKVQNNLSLCAEVHKAGTLVTVHGTVEATFVRQCVRCLKDYDAFETLPFAVEYRRESSVSSRPAPSRPSQDRTEEVDPESEDVYDFTGDELDLSAMLREQVILAVPMQPLCDAECLGLCPVCGQDRNERACECPEPLEESPFAALKKLRTRTEEGDN